MKKLCVVHLEEHACDLSSELGLRVVDERVKTLSDHVLLHLRTGGGERTGGKGALGRNGCLRLGRGGHLLGRGSLGRHIGVGVSHLLVELDAVLAATAGLAATTAASTSREAASTAWLLGHAAILGHGIHPALLLHHGVHHSRATRHHRVCRLHAGATLHVHGHSAPGVAHGDRAPAHTGAAALRSMAGLELGAANVLALRKGDEDWLRSDDLRVHFVNGAGCFLRGRVANEAEATGPAILHILHDASGGDRAHGGELVAEHVVGNVVVKIFDV